MSWGYTATSSEWKYLTTGSEWKYLAAGSEWKFTAVIGDKFIETQGGWYLTDQDGHVIITQQ